MRQNVCRVFDKPPFSLYSHAMDRLKQFALEKLLATCPHCAAEATQLESSVINQSEAAELVHVRCRSCQGSVVALLFSTGPIISSIGLITDLSREDAVRFQQADELSEDNLISLHEWLRQPTSTADMIAQAISTAYLA